MAPLLRERYRLTTRRAYGGLEDGFGSDLRPGGLVQVIQRCASRLATEEDRRLEAPRSSGVQRADETSWWVAQPECGGPRREAKGEKILWWPWVFADKEQTVFRVDPRRGREGVRKVLGSEYGGVLVSECLQTYDDAARVQQKCHAHHLNATSRAQDDCEAKNLF